MCSDRPPGGRDRSSLYVDSTPGQPTRALSPLLTLALAVICLEACEPLRTRGPAAAHPTLPSAAAAAGDAAHARRFFIFIILCAAAVASTAAAAPSAFAG